MSSLKRLVSVLAVALFVILGTAQSATAARQPAPPDGTEAVDGLSPQANAQPPLPTPGPPPERKEDPLPDGGVPGWLWVVIALLAGVTVTVAVSLWRGSRGPANADPLLESTAELAAVGQRQRPTVSHYVSQQPQHRRPSHQPQRRRAGR